MNDEQLSRYLYQGLGRPYIIAQKSPHLLSQQKLLEACVYNPVYDRQCTGTRISYFLELINIVGNKRYFYEGVLSALQHSDDDMDIEQLFEFVTFFAKQGDAQARQVLYEQFLRLLDEQDAFGAEQIVQIDGFEGFCYVAEAIGKQIMLDETFWEDEYLLKLIEDQLGTETVAERLTERRKTSRAISVYLDRVNDKRSKHISKTKRKVDLTGKPYVALKEYIGQSGVKPTLVQLRKWCQEATTADIEQAAYDLQYSPQEVGLRELLYIFSRRIFPLEVKLLQPHVYNQDQRIATSAINAISNIKSQEVRNLGLNLLNDTTLQGKQLRLFVENYVSGDEDMFLALLQRSTSDDEVHEIVHCLNDVYQQNSNVNATQLLLELYEQGPCEICRTHTVKNIIDIQAIPDWMAQECSHDADEDTRELVLPQNL